MKLTINGARLLAVLLMVSCGSDQTTSRPEVFELVAALRNDSVFLAPFEEHFIKLVWRRGDREVWRSGNLYAGRPQVTIADLNGDGETDVFWTMHYEEFVGAEAVIGSPRGPVAVHPDFDLCVAAQLEEDDDGYLIVASEGGVYPPAECGGAVPMICGEEGYWPRYLRVQDTSLVEVFPRDRYAAKAREYRAKAIALDSTFADPGFTNDLSQICGSDFPDRLRALADSAERVASLLEHGR